MKIIKIKNIVKWSSLLLAIAALAFNACKKEQPKRITQYNIEEEELIVNPPSNNIPQDTLVPNTATKVVFKLGEYSSTIPNFKDSVQKALGILSDIFSSQEFKDSLMKYTFICANGSTQSCIGNNPLLHRTKCDAGLNLIKGQTVYEDLVADSIVNINILIQKSNSDKPSMGFTYVCSGRITSNDYWLKNDNKFLPLTQEYAVHLAHEFTHTVGYVHGDHLRSQDVAYKIGGIVKNILTRKANLSLLVAYESLAPVLGTKGFNQMRIKVSDLPGLSPDFMKVYNQTATGFGTTDQTISYMYLQFLPDSLVRLSFRIINSSGTYFILNFDHQINMNDDGIAKLTYTGTNNANTTNRDRVQPIIDYLTSHTFAIDFMKASAPANAIVGGFTSVDNPDSFFYGVMLD